MQRLKTASRRNVKICKKIGRSLRSSPRATPKETNAPYDRPELQSDAGLQALKKYGCANRRGILMGRYQPALFDETTLYRDL
jgi:hypothetical protein